MIEVKVEASAILAKYGRLPERLRSGVRDGVVESTQLVAVRVREKLNGEVLKVQSGKLLGSIKSEMVENSSQITGRVYSSGVPYAAIHEYGGVINHPGSDKFQVFEIGGETIFTHGTRPHVINMPERSYLRSSLEELRKEITEILREAATKSWAA